jgi:Holliday junction resolvase
MDFNDPKLITELAFRLLPSAEEIARGGLGDVTLQRVADRLAMIRDGLAPEIEFISAVNWLGHCLAVNRIDQLPLPRYLEGEEFRVPDVLAICRKGEKTVPVLIEIKKTLDDEIVWTEAYLFALRRFAEAMKMPILIAWKRGSIWTLNEIAHFQKRVKSYHLPWLDAMKENLMGLLFGDLHIMFTQRVSFFLDAEIESEQPLPALPMVLPEGRYTLTVKKAGFLLDGAEANVTAGLQWMFFFVPDESHVHRTSESAVRIMFTPKPDTSVTLGDCGLGIMLWRYNNPEAIDWEAVARKRIGPLAAETRDALKAGIEQGVVQYVLDQVPQTVPDFLK